MVRFESAARVRRCCDPSLRRRGGQDSTARCPAVRVMRRRVCA